MTVAELMEQLKEMPQENTVWIDVPYTVIIGSKEKSDYLFQPLNLKEMRESIVSSKLTMRIPKGLMRGWAGDYLIRDINGEEEPCRKDIFEATYELVEIGDSK